jgi:hypothetical protein
LICDGRRDTEFAFFDPSGNATAFGVKSYSMLGAIGGQFQLHSGIFFNDVGDESRFIVAADPVPVIVLIAVIRGRLSGGDRDRRTYN